MFSKIQKNQLHLPQKVKKTRFSRGFQLQKQRASGVKFYNLSVLLSHLHELLTEKGMQNPSKQTESGHTCIMELSMISIHYAS